MSLRSSAGSVLTAVLVLVLIAMFVGQQLGQPILLGFVVTGSMSPTLEPGDGFVAVPPALAGDIEDGDVVTFDAQELEGGGLTTHRIVGRTDEGYITRGDANPFTDQDSDEPPVQESQIAAVALQVNGEVVVLPNLGTAAMAMQEGVGFVVGIVAGVPGMGGLADGDLGTMMLVGGGALLLYSFAVDSVSSGRGRDSRSTSRGGVIRASVVLLVILSLIVVPITASMVLPSGTDDITIVSSDAPSESPTVIQRGGSETVDYEITNSGYITRVAIIEPASTGVVIDQTTHVVSRGQTSGTTATIYAPEETGTYVRSISEWQYVRLLPVPVIVRLHAIHPFVVVAAIDLAVIVALSTVFVVAVGLEPLRLRSRSRNVSLGEWLRRKL
ncbi:signal peptidase I [Halobellus sp. GM3]|uniref:signal peptidase I n=1 Tax=Halobellus sp. GM3 TaxID=3458410 RepID=UPI00403D755F